MTDFEKIKCERCKGTGIDPESLTNEASSCKKCSGLKELDWVQNITGVELTRIDKAIIYSIKTLNDLVEKGVLEDGGMTIGSEGEELIKGFKPTKEELEIAMAILKKEGHLG